MYKITKICEEDYHNGYLQLLEQLTVVEADKISYEDFCNRLHETNSTIFIMVDSVSDKVVACGSIFIEKKFIHHLGSVGHIEDVVVDVNHRKEGFGKMVINKLTKYAKKRGCYKVILDCDEKNIKFYEKCGYEKKGTLMARYF